MLTQSFFAFLEYHLSESFQYSQDEVIKHFWCDGILLPSNELDYSKKVVNDKRQLQLKAFLGKEGQDEYLMLLKFGNKSLSRYARNLDIKDCVPNSEKDDWYIIDPKNKQIEIQLL